MTASDVAFTIFIILLFICIVAMAIMNVGMSRGWMTNKIASKLAKRDMTGELKEESVIKPSISIGVSAATAVCALVIVIIYCTKKNKK